MNLFQKSLCAVGAAAMLVFSPGASAAPVTFNVTATDFSIGTGYGVDFSETSGNLLDVRFSTAIFLAQNFALDAQHSFKIFSFGSIDLAETDKDGGILADETDDLGIDALLSFTGPSGVSQTLTFTATVTANTGSVSDDADDYLIHWSPVTMEFGNGGSFQIKLNDLSFDRAGEQPVTAMITLKSASDEGDPAPPQENVPEPASIALLGIGIACAAVARRRRAKA